MPTLAIVTAGFLIGATRGVVTLFISGIAFAIFAFVGSHSESLFQALVRCIGWFFVLDTGFILALMTSAFLRNRLSAFSQVQTRALQRRAGLLQIKANKVAERDSYDGVSRPRGS